MEAGAPAATAWRSDDDGKGYVYYAPKRAVPLNRMGPRSTFNLAFEMLAPPTGYGRLGWIAEHFPNVPRTTFRSWRRGEKPAPQWARDRLAEHLRQDAYEKLAVADLLQQKEKAPD